MSRIPRLVSGTALLLAPAFGLAWSVTQAPFTGYRAELEGIAAHPRLWLCSTLLGIAMSYLLIPAAGGFVMRTEGGAPVLAWLGGGLACAGAALHGSVLGFQLTEAPLVASGLPMEQLEPLVSRLYDHPAFMWIVLPVFALYLGLALLSAALWRCGAAPRWVPALILLGIAVELFSPLDFKARIMFALFLLAFGRVGLDLLRDAPGRRAAVPAPAVPATLAG